MIHQKNKNKQRLINDVVIVFISPFIPQSLDIRWIVYYEGFGCEKSAIREVLRFIIPIPKHNKLQYGFQSRNNKQRYNIRNNLILIVYSSLCMYEYKNRTFILQSVHLLYKYAIRINVCFIRSIRIHLSAYE
jgi:hypothetical protein